MRITALFDLVDTSIHFTVLTFNNGHFGYLHLIQSEHGNTFPFIFLDKFPNEVNIAQCLLVY